MATTPTLDEVIPSTQTPSVGTSTYAPPPVYKPPDEATVAGQMKGLIDSNSPYIKAAEEGAMRTAAARGLVNSSMAAGAGRKAAIEASLPIAQQDATVNANAGLAGFQGELTAAQSQLETGQKSGLSEQQLGESQSLATTQAGLQKEINTAESGNKLEQIAADYSGKQGIIESQGALDTALEQQKQVGATERANAENAVNTAKITSDEKKDAIAKFSAFGDAYAKQVQAVQVDASLGEAAKTSIVAQLQTEYKNNLRMVSALTGVEITW